jgi:hypothetical protein
MWSLAVLWFQLQMAEQSLREKYFAPAKTEPTGIGTPRRASVKQVLRIESAEKARASVCPSQNLIRVISCRLGKLGSDKAEKPPRSHRASR